MNDIKVKSHDNILANFDKTYKVLTWTISVYLNLNDMSIEPDWQQKLSKCYYE